MSKGKHAFNGKYNYANVKQFFPTLVDTSNMESLPPAPKKLSAEQTTLVTNKALTKFKPKLSMPLDAVLEPKKASNKKQQGIYSWYFEKMGWGIFATAVSLAPFCVHVSNAVISSHCCSYPWMPFSDLNLRDWPSFTCVQ